MSSVSSSTPTRTRTQTEAPARRPPFTVGHPARGRVGSPCLCTCLLCLFSRVKLVIWFLFVLSENDEPCVPASTVDRRLGHAREWWRRLP